MSRRYSPMCRRICILPHFKKVRKGTKNFAYMQIFHKKIAPKSDFFILQSVGRSYNVMVLQCNGPTAESGQFVSELQRP